MKYLIGILIGAGAILPGISSGVLCVIFGIYEKLLNSVLNFFDDIKNNFKFLFPIVIGIICGVILFANILKMLFNTYYMPTCFAFIGLIVGSIPSIINQANVKKIKPTHILCLLLTFTFSIYLVSIEKNINLTSNTIDPNLLNLIISGFAMSIGIVVPGISSSVILMLLGTYNIYLDSVSTVNLSILIPLGIGLIAGGFAFLKLIQFLLNNFRTHTYFLIIGFTLRFYTCFISRFRI